MYTTTPLRNLTLTKAPLALFLTSVSIVNALLPRHVLNPAWLVSD